MALRTDTGSDERGPAGHEPVAAPAPTESADATPEQRGFDWVTVAALGIYAAAFVVSTVIWGFPLGRERLIVWLALGMLAATIRHPARWARGMIIDWLPLVAVLITYDYLRGAADGLGFQLHMWSLIHFDEWLFGGTVPTVRLQRAFLDPDRVYWWDLVAWATYTSHFVASFVVAAVLWVRNRKRFHAYVARFVALSYMGFITYMLFPAVPPWLAGRYGAIPPVYRSATRGWSHFGLHTAAQLFEKGQASVNLVAAMPSLHAAYAALICAFFWKAAKPIVRVVLAGYPLLMAWTLVYTAEHWVIDILIGWLYVAIVMVVGALISRWWRRRKAAEAQRDATQADATSATSATTSSEDRPVDLSGRYP
ncbi:MAG: phosphatase PAP2 family protein [Acidimicrobiia bacterium]